VIHPPDPVVGPGPMPTRGPPARGHSKVHWVKNTPPAHLVSTSDAPPIADGIAAAAANFSPVPGTVLSMRYKPCEQKA
jgi:hypothetical protein